MAKLHSYYVLCPLIDQKSFLGVTRDKDTENVIVTLSRNVVNKYRLSDQKQIGGWTSKDHITSSVIYDHEVDSYIGVFNNNTIKTWKNETENLEKLKKNKFSLSIQKLLPRRDHSSLIVFSNGNCASLSYGLENRKTLEGKSIFKNNESLLDACCYSQNKSEFVCYITKSNNNKYEIVTCPLRYELGDLEKSKLSREKVEREEKHVYVVGRLISVTDNPFVYILWSDSKMTVFDLIKKTWKTIGMVPWISSSTNVSLAGMGDKHLILFGSNIDQDGAIIVAYNTALGVGSCRYPMKMYSDDAKLYCFNGRIVLESSNHIGMLPYIVESSRSLSSLLGSHEVIQNDFTEVAEWGNSSKITYKVCNEMKELLALGVTERTMCLQIIPPILEKNDFKKLAQVSRDFKDLPEPALVILLSYCIKLVNAESVNITDKEEFTSFCSTTDNTQLEKLELLKGLFQIPFSDALLIPYLQNGLSMNDAMFLMNYISYLLVDSNEEYDSVYESKLFDWCTLLIDAFYQQYLMTKDDKVSYVLENMRNIVVNLINQTMVINSTLPFINKMLNGKNIEESEETLSYSIELMQI